MKVYLDSAASSQIHPEVMDVIIQNFELSTGNPSSTHSFGRASRAVIEQSRKKIASLLKVQPSEIIFTSCGTEANNMVIKSCVLQENVEKIITTSIEHKCILESAAWLMKHASVQVFYLPVDQKGRPSLADLRGLLDQMDGKTLVSIMHANNEIGTMINLKEFADLCYEYEALFHSDTVQSMGAYELDLPHIGLHFCSGSAHKFHGPTGIGFLYKKEGALVHPLIHGGGQERGYRSGTENMPYIAAMAKALELAVNNREANRKHVLELKNYCLEQLRKEDADIRVNGCLDQGLAKVLSIGIDTSVSPDMLLFNLDLKGIAISGGSACSSGASKGSYVLQELGVQENIKSIRVSFSIFNTKDDIDYFVKSLNEITKKVAV